MLKTEISPEVHERCKKLAEMYPASLFLVAAEAEPASERFAHRFRPSSDFFYLTGLDEQESFLVIRTSQDGQSFHKVLFVPPRDEVAEIWEGERYGPDRAVSVFGADEGYATSEFRKILPSLVQDSARVYFRLNRHPKVERMLIAALEKARRSRGRSGAGMLPILDSGEAIGELRIHKSSQEKVLMHRAGQISAHAHVAAMEQIRPGMMEYEIQAILEYEFKRRGCDDVSYQSIVAGGENACCLHYRRNNDKLKEGSLLLIDAGGEFEFYASDITRTSPVSKNFTKEQAEIYEVVLASQKAAIEVVKVGVPYKAIHDRACEVLAQGLIDLKILSGTVSDVIAKGDLKKFYPHSTGHLIGLDVHDVGKYQTESGESRPLEHGMAFTVEPGLYFQPDHADSPEKYRGIGVRIEDDVIVEDSGVTILTSDVPKERNEVEKLRASAF